jgi:hypothetical protein
MKTSILALAIGVVLGCPVASYAAENSNVIEGLSWDWTTAIKAIC